jgi:hypothetical protein
MMKLNLIPPSLRPTRVSPLPYMPLAGLAAICGIWLLTQFASVSGARKELRQSKAEVARLQGELRQFAGLADDQAAVEEEAERLRLRAALVTQLTRDDFICSPILGDLTQCVPKNLRLTQVALDPGKGRGQLLGYGSPDSTDFEVTNMLRALHTRPTVQQTFAALRLQFCHGAKVGDKDVKKFSILLRFRAPVSEEPSAEGA